MNHAEAKLWAHIRELYDKIPKTKCQGKCQSYCKGIIFTPIENKLIGQKTGQKLLPIAELKRRNGHDKCPRLDDTTGRCTIYEYRPWVCRLWGGTEHFRCPWGCETEGTPLTFREEADLINELEFAGGAITQDEYELNRWIYDDPERLAIVRKWADGGISESVWAEKKEEWRLQSAKAA